MKTPFGDTQPGKLSRGEGGGISRAYPDSVSRVKPPKTTMPKTLAALPSSQYATLLELVFGKVLDLPSVVAAASATMALPALISSMMALFRSGCVDFHLTDCRTEGRDEDGGAETAVRIGELRHGLHANRRRESRGAALRSCGNAWNTEAMTAASGGEEGETQVFMSLTLAFQWFVGGARQAKNPAYQGLTGRKRRQTPTHFCITATASPDPRYSHGTQPSHTRSLSYSRSMPSLANHVSVPKRPIRQADQRVPIVQLQTQIDRAQKSADDPTTPLEDHGRRRTTLDLMRSEHAVRTDISRLFSESAGSRPPSYVSQPPSYGSRPPSYITSAGPLYLRASGEAVPLPDHLYTRGLLEGRHSDITIIAFGQRYPLHRLILDRAPFFTMALSEPWLESRSKEVVLHPEEIDTSITQTSFELAIRKLYGVDISKEMDAEAIGLFATGCWLEMQDLIDSAIESILRQMAPETLAYLIRLVTSNYYGRSRMHAILESAKAMLSRNGWEMPIKYWDDMPGDIIRELVGSDGFFVHSEWDRWVLAKRLLDRRLRQAAIDAGLMIRGQKPIPQAPNSLRLMAVRFDGVYRQNALTTAHSSSDAQADWLALYTLPDVERLLVLLDEGIHYMHMEYEQLEFIKNARDVFGLPVMPERVISNALWQQLALRQRVLNTDESAQELGLCQTPPPPEASNVATKSGSEMTFKGKQIETAADPDGDIESDSWDGNGKPRKFWIPSSDCNIVLGNGADPVVTTSNSFQRHASRLSASIQPEDAQWATDFASTPSTFTNPNTRMDFAQRPISAGGGNAGQPKPIAYTEFPPFRFSAEFPNPRFLKEKKRVYSRTVSYAGSLWNIYIQKVRSAKNVQLGVYLHRAKEREVEEAVHSSTLSQQNNGSVDERIGQLEREMLMRSDRRDRRRSTRVPFMDPAAEEDTSGSGGDPDTSLGSPGLRNPLFPTNSLGRHRTNHISSLPTRGVSQWGFQNPSSSVPQNGEAIDPSSFPHAPYCPSEHESDTSSDNDESDAAAYANPSLASRTQRKTRAVTPALPPYVDARPTIKTYFKIYSPSKGGRMLSIYESAPDRFNFSQSWGWKSSTLMLDEINLSGGAGGGGGDDTLADANPAASKKTDGKLRFMVVIGNL
ncbi:BTB POZ domain-containing [Pyrenophora seminiperda CCB06]|uniref:BTB POZ domain-containing n=1 Tax=Pyrenophora seminiperda CCB06 TaxID=1302712 RepID=A0A3M7M2E5_9PLEO|nr:BTB POZ domain-containing [Pyrenophora seminiperda CCB06]